VHLIDNINLVFSRLRRKAYLLYQATDIFHRVVAGGIQFMYVQRSAIVEGGAGAAGIAGLRIGCTVFAIDSLGQYPGTGSFAHATGTTKQECMRQLILADRIFKGCGNMLLAYYRVECLWPVFPCRYNEFFHTNAVKLAELAEFPGLVPDILAGGH
jgi:hypothetical protein